MEGLAQVEKIIALIGAIIVGVFAVIALKQDWNAKGLDNNVTKLLLGLMAFGCVLVMLAAVNVLGKE
jgi:adenine/guanine phosphoribosyltransferase-like PRPP-binding protein